MDSEKSTNGTRQRRRDARIEVAWNVACEKLAEMGQTLHPELAKVYERIAADNTDIGKRFAGTVRDLSVNGCFVEGHPLPLLSRVGFVIEVPSYRTVEAVGWVLWRRKEVCTVTRPNGAPITLGPGFGVVFEWISLESRIEIARRVALLS
ncbi:MAG: PilZ domain-containing protein [Polyangia bacterium]